MIAYVVSRVVLNYNSKKSTWKLMQRKKTNWLQLEFLSADQAEFCWKWLLRQHLFLLDVKNNFYV